MNLKPLGLILSLILLTGCASETTITVSTTPTQFDKQQILQSAAIKNYVTDEYTPHHPYIVHDPYHNSPLSYLVMFETDEPVKIRYTVVGHHEETSLTFETSDYNRSHQLTLIGLYPNQENTIYLTTINESGVESSYPLTIQTPPLPEDALSINVNQSKEYFTFNRLFLITDDHYKYLIDESGEIRWIQTSTSGSITPLNNGHLLTYNGPYYFYYHQRLEEIDYLGQVHQQLYIPGSGHHSLSETTTGDYIINSSDKTSERFAEDVIYILDSKTGTVRATINLRDYLDIHRFSETLPDVTGDFNDWFHLNYAMLDESDQTIIASGRSQSIVVKLNPQKSEINWILGAPDEVNESLQSYLLTPIGDSFSWPFAQHSAKVIDDLDQNPETTDLILFDNHVDIGVFPKQLYPDLGQYSRAVHYRINEREMTIEQIWSFGENLRPPLVSTIISEIDYLKDSNSMLVLYGFLALNQQTGGKLFEVDASDSSHILLEMELLHTGINHIYTVESVDFSTLNLETTFVDSNQSPLASSELNRYKESLSILDTAIHDELKAESFESVELSDDVLLLKGYLSKTAITDPLALVLTHESGTTYSFTISPSDTYLVKEADELPSSLQRKYKKMIQSHSLYRFIDRTDLSHLPNGTYQLSLYLESSKKAVLYETPYQIILEP